ncbi:3-hydroxyacyl-CoA dehydrogenase family protein [Streptomyces sp. NPDC093094]|uniref:3-hydroxyacyl-CoA dehydrogenase family protein n=1 Tax=Streptomyces sp. NPDC093094 TaxID=3366026 RepID=UPI003830B668
MTAQPPLPAPAPAPVSAPAIGIVGLGSVGEALLLLLHGAGHRVVGVDTDPAVLARVGRRAGAAGPAGAPGPVLTDDHALLRETGLVVEAVPEDRAVKAEALRRITGVCPPGTPLITTTVSAPLARLAIASGRPADLAGLRLFTPPSAGSPVEPVHTALTSAGTAAALELLLDAAGLTAVEVGTQPAADATALVLGLLNRAAALYDEGYVPHHAVDTAMRLGCGLPAGPLETLDRIGLDTAHAALSDLWQRTGDRSFAPAPVLGRMIAEGRPGRKAGRGFYSYDETGTLLPEHTGVPDETTARPVHRVGVVGSGAMARGIAEVTASAGHPTVLVARSAGKARGALDGIADSLTRGVRRGKVTPAARDEALAVLEGTADLGALARCDLVIEAVAEDPDVKREMFTALGEVCAPGTVLATTTSSLSVAACAEASGRPADVVGLHFFNPAPVMRLVEIVHAPATAPATLATARAFCRGLRKTAVECPDRTGFIVNSLLFPYLGAALALLDRPGADDRVVERTDTAVQHGFGYPMGPFALLDTIGLDVSLAIQNRLYERFPTPDYLPSQALSELVAADLLGRKNRQGLRTASLPAR